MSRKLEALIISLSVVTGLALATTSITYNQVYKFKIEDKMNCVKADDGKRCYRMDYLRIEGSSNLKDIEIDESQKKIQYKKIKIENSILGCWDLRLPSFVRINYGK